MSTGKRLAKRSIVGTRVCAPYDGLYLTGTINNIKSPSLDTRDTFYSVLFDGLVNGRRTQFDYRADELVGHGFQTITSSNAKLVKGQRVYMTLNGREIGATVECHDEYTDEVFLTVDITANNANSHLIQTNVKRRLDELRLLESRKSARLIDLDTDYSRLALEGQTEQQIRGRSSSMSSSISSSMSSSSTNTSNGRKRRSSDSSESSDDVMDDCTAAMILMSLSCSPKSPPIIPLETSNESSNTISSCQSPLSSPGKITFFTSSSAPNWSHLDDHSYEYLKPTVRNITPSGEEKTLNGYSCVNNQSKRVTHIKKQGTTDSNGSSGSSGLSNMHGNSILSSPINIPNISFSHQYATSAPVAIPSSRANHKYMRLDGTGGSLNAANNNNNSINNHLNCNTNNSIDKGGSSLLLSPPSSSSTNKNSPTKRGRGESRKCRKVYGMDNRDSWCTQCKWKKACSRFTD